MSSDVDVVVSGSDPAFWASDVRAESASPAGLGLIGSPAMIACHLQHALCGPGLETGQCAGERVAARKRQANTNVGMINWSRPACLYWSSGPAWPWCPARK